MLDNGVWTLLIDECWHTLAPDISPSAPLTGYEWPFGSRLEGEHRIIVTQFRGRTNILFVTSSRLSGRRTYLTSPAEARAGFAHEIDLWTTKAARLSPRWPLELQPGYDANAIFAVLAAQEGAPAIVAARPLAAEFLKLPSATEAQRMMFSEAYGKLGAEPDRWAYTETSRGLEDKRTLVTRVDPSRPEAQPVLLKGGAAARVLLVKIARDFETTRTDFRRVEPYAEAGK